MAAERAAVRGTQLAGWGWFCAWALIGGLSVLGLISFVVVFALAIVPLAGLGVLMAMRPDARRSAFGLLSGAGFLFLYVAYVQRDGPGTTCWHTATGSGCDEHLNPLPWLIVGVVLVIAGIVGHAIVNRSQRVSPS
jgi:hypothetical protein